jgi:phage anti-repressor protein
MNELMELKEQFEKIAQSTEKFPVDFDKAWQWVEYSNKANALRILQGNFKAETDYSSVLRNRSDGKPGKPYKAYYLTIYCFESFCMLAQTDKGKEVRDFFIKIKEAWNTLEMLIKRLEQMGALPGRETWKMPSAGKIRQLRKARKEEIISVQEFRRLAFNLNTPYMPDNPIKGANAPIDNSNKRNTTPHSESTLPAPAELSQRDQLRRVINRNARIGRNYAGAWYKLYDQFYHRYHRNIRVCAKNRDMNPLDYAESEGIMNELLSLAISLYGQD